MALEPDKCSWFEFKTIIEDDLNFKTPFSLYYVLPHVLTYDKCSWSNCECNATTFGQNVNYM